MTLVLIKVVASFVLLLSSVRCQIGYTRHLSDLRIKELQNLAVRLEHSINKEKSPCVDYFDYVCSRNRPMFSIMGSLPSEGDLINLMIELNNDATKFDAKRKLMLFFLSCQVVKSIDDCYREVFHYFRPLFAHVITTKRLDRYDHKNLMDVLDRFILKAKKTDHFATHSFKYKLESLRDKLKYPQLYFQIPDLDKEYENVTLYRDSYDYNVKTFEGLDKTNMFYTHGVPKTILDWTLYLYQSRDKPMSYYYATLNLHLWMMFYNSTGRMEQKKYEEIADCLKLSPALNALEEARMLAVIYIKSLQNAWIEYRDWITSTTISQEIYDHENEILKRYKLDNKKLFFTLYAQNFCDFGKDLAENIFFLGLKTKLRLLQCVLLWISDP